MHLQRNATQRNATQRIPQLYLLLTSNFKSYISQFFRTFNFLSVFIRFAKNHFEIISQLNYGFCYKNYFFNLNQVFRNSYDLGLDFDFGRNLNYDFEKNYNLGFGKNYFANCNFGYGFGMKFMALEII